MMSCCSWENIEMKQQKTRGQGVFRENCGSSDSCKLLLDSMENGESP